MVCIILAVLVSHSFRRLGRVCEVHIAEEAVVLSRLDWLI